MPETRDLQTLVVSLEARTRQFERQLQKARSDADKQVGGIEKRFLSANRSIATALNDFTRGLVAGAAAGGIVGAFNAVRTAISDLARTAADAQKAGLGAEAFQELAFVAQQSKVSLDAMTDGLKELQLRADEFIVTGKGPAAEAFARIGLTPEELKTRLRDPAALLEEITERVRTLDKAAQIRVFDEIFGGTGGEQFVQILEQGAGAIGRLRQEARDTGQVIGDDLLREAVKVDKQFSRIAGTVGNSVKRAIVEIVPVVAQLAERLQAVIAAAGDLDKSLTGGLLDRFDPRALGEASGRAFRDFVRGPNADRNDARARLAQQLQSGATTDLSAFDQLGRSRSTASASTISTENASTSSARAARAVVDGYRQIQVEAQRRIADLQTEIALVGKSAEEQARIRMETELLAAADAKGVTLTAERRAEIAAYAQEGAKLVGTLEAVEDAQDRVNQAQQLFADIAFDGISGLIDGTADLNDLLANMAKRLADAALQAALLGQGPMGGFYGFSRKEKGNECLQSLAVRGRGCDDDGRGALCARRHAAKDRAEGYPNAADQRCHGDPRGGAACKPFTAGNRLVFHDV